MSEKALFINDELREADRHGQPDRLSRHSVGKECMCSRPQTTLDRRLGGHRSE